MRNPTYKRFITGPLLRFDDRNGGFSRSLRESIAKLGKAGIGKVAEGLPSTPPKLGKKGYEQKDYALLWPGGIIDDLVRRTCYSRDVEIAENKVDVSNKAAITQQVKSVARWFGANLVGICEVKPSWVYACWGDNNAVYSGGLANPGNPIKIPSWLKYAIVMAVEMDYEQNARSPAVEGTTDLGYAKVAFICALLATYIGHLGYHAMPSGNDFALNIPLAIDAGLGELGRNGLLITEQFGPRIQICKVFTELPLEVDSPIDIGVQAFCERCQRCADACPARALMSGERTDKAWDISNNINVLKWPIKAMDCLSWWHKNRAYCSNCIRVCPFNKPRGWLHSLVRKIVKATPVFDRFFVKMDRILGYGKQVVK